MNSSLKQHNCFLLYHILLLRTGNFLCEVHGLSLLLLLYRMHLYHTHHVNPVRQMMLYFLPDIFLHLPNTLPMSFLRKHMNIHSQPLPLFFSVLQLHHSMILLPDPLLPDFLLLPVHSVLLSKLLALPASSLLYNLTDLMRLRLQLPVPVLMCL